MREPNNPVSEDVDNHIKQWFFAVEHTSQTSAIDIDDFCALLTDICPRYHLKWCQAVWKKEKMQRIKRGAE